MTNKSHCARHCATPTIQHYIYNTGALGWLIWYIYNIIYIYINIRMQPHISILNMITVGYEGPRYEKVIVDPHMQWPRWGHDFWDFWRPQLRHVDRRTSVEPLGNNQWGSPSPKFIWIQCLPCGWDGPWVSQVLNLAAVYPSSQSQFCNLRCGAECCTTATSRHAQVVPVKRNVPRATQEPNAESPIPNSSRVQLHQPMHTWPDRSSQS